MVKDNVLSKGHDTSTNSPVESGPVGVCVMRLQLKFLLHFSIVSDCLVKSGPFMTQQWNWVA